MKIIHFADAHVNNVTSGRVLGGIPIRVLDIFANFEMLINYAIHEEVDYVLFAGDMYLGNHPANHYRTAVHRHIKRLARANIKVVMIPGNHDMSKNSISDHALSEFRYLAPENVYLADKPDTLYFDDLVVTCIPWQYTPLTYEAPEIYDRPHFALAHCTLSCVDFADNTGEVLLGKDFVVDIDYFNQFDYAALGHIHTAQQFGHIVYPGSMELLTWGEARDGSTHGFIHWVDGHIEKIPYKMRPRSEIKINLDASWTLPDPDPETIYEIEFTSDDPMAKVPQINDFINGAFSVTSKLNTPRLTRYRETDYAIGLDWDKTKQLATWFAANDLNFEDYKELWTDILDEV